MKQLLLILIFLSTLASAFSFDVWESKLTLTEAIQIAKENNIPLRKDGVVATGKNFKKSYLYLDKYPKKCLSCKTQHYMNVGRIIINEEYKILSQDKEPFRDETTFSKRFSIARREPSGNTNAYYCPNCQKWIANNKFIADEGRKLYEDEEIIIGQIGLF